MITARKSQTSSDVPSDASAGVAAARMRLGFLDITKGVLVILMVIYHSLNYSNQYHLGFRYMSFLPPSFILITGVLLSYVYSARYAAGDRRLVGRLLIRGTKLLLLFTALNVVAQFVRSPAYGRSMGVENFFYNWNETYFTGNGRRAAFEVLLPIAYLLLIAPALIWAAHLHRAVLPGLAIAFVGTCAVIDHYGGSSSNLNLMSAGIVGMLGGRLISRPDRLGRFAIAAAIAYALYFPLGVARGYVYLVQILGACIVLLLLCGIGARVGDTGWWHQRLIRLGQYSLVAYIAQIGILQILSRFLGRPDPVSVESGLVFLTTLVLTAGIVETIDWLCARSRAAEKIYRAVFA